MVAAIAAAVVLAGCAGQAGGPASPEERGDGAVVAQEQLPESRKGGDRSWRKAKDRAGDMAALSAYADRSSALPGDEVSLHVSTTADTFTVRAYRMGHYRGAQARLVWTSPQVAGQVQSEEGYDADVRMHYAEWDESARVDTAGWLPGMYLLRLVGDNGAEWLVPLVLRDRDVAGKLMIVIPDTTSQVYNTWGGRSAYTGPGGFADRSRAVSYSRPYVEGGGAGRYLFLAHPVVALAEKADLPVTYVAASDLDVEKGAMTGAEGVVILGHDEYWTPLRRRETESVRDAGTDLAFLGANTMYWRTRIEDGPQNLPRITIYKDAAEDPVSGKRTTVRFRDDPAGEAERSLIGMDYECYPATGTYVVADPDFFLFAGTGVSRGQQFAGIVDIEVDRAYPLPGTPDNLQIVADNPTDCGGPQSVSHSTYYTVDSGAGVFATGSIGWITRAMRSFAPDDPRNSPQDAKRFVRTVTLNLLRAMAAGSLGESHPAVGNIDDFDLPTRNTTGKA